MSKTRTVWVARDGNDQWSALNYTIASRRPKKIQDCRYEINGAGDYFGSILADLLGLNLKDGECDRFEITVRRVGELILNRPSSDASEM